VPAGAALGGAALPILALQIDGVLCAGRRDGILIS
jgi:hypothetical protein